MGIVVRLIADLSGPPKNRLMNHKISLHFVEIIGGQVEALGCLWEVGRSAEAP